MFSITSVVLDECVFGVRTYCGASGEEEVLVEESSRCGLYCMADKVSSLTLQVHLSF